MRDNARFRQVRHEGASYTHPLMVLCCQANGEAISRTGFTVSKRIGTAVERNRARRRMREMVRLVWDAILPGWDLVWIARPGINEAEFTELQDACARLLRRARLLRAPDMEREAAPGDGAP